MATAAIIWIALVVIVLLPILVVTGTLGTIALMIRGATKPSKRKYKEAVKKVTEYEKVLKGDGLGVNTIVIPVEYQEVKSDAGKIVFKK